MDKQIRFQLCCHEAGHAIASHFLKSRRVETLHVIADTGGYCAMGKFARSSADSRDKFEALLLQSCAGPAAGDRARLVKWTITGTPPAKLKPIPPLAAVERDKTFCRIFVDAHRDQKETDTTFQEELARKIFPESWGAYLYWINRRAVVFVEKSWPFVLAVAIPLFHNSFLNRRDFLRVIEETKGNLKCAQ